MFVGVRSMVGIHNRDKSCPVDVLSGVLQGSVLGPLLFLLYVNGVTDVISTECDLSLFTDDILLYSEIRVPNDYLVVQENIDSVFDWSRKESLEFNTSKCKFMKISRKQSSHDPPKQLHMVLRG